METNFEKRFNEMRPDLRDFETAENFQNICLDTCTNKPIAETISFILNSDQFWDMTDKAQKIFMLKMLQNMRFPKS